MPLTRKYITGDLTFIIFTPTLIAIIYYRLDIFNILVIILVVLVFRIYTIILISLLVRLLKSSTYLNLNSNTPFLVGTLIMLSRNLVVTRNKVTLEVSSYKLSSAIRRVYKTIIRSY